MVPPVSDLTLVGQRTVLTIYAGGASEEIAALGLVAREDPDLHVVAVLSGFTSSQIYWARSLVGEDVDIIIDPLADQLRAAYLVGSRVAPGGITFLIDETGVVVFRRCGSPIWLVHDDLAVARTFAEFGEVPQNVDHQYVLDEGESASMPSFVLLDQEAEELHFDDGRPRLLYNGPSPATEKGALILAELDALREEFPAVEFVWHSNYTSDEELSELWKLYQSVNLAHLHTDWYGLPYETYIDAVIDGRNADLEKKASELFSTLTDWRLVFDPGNRLGKLWCLRVTPYVMILDGTGTVALSYTVFPTSSTGGEWRVHPLASDELRKVLARITLE